jgi:adenosylmethionine-8-amino-7-oxononanoate aminotransferase
LKSVFYSSLDKVYKTIDRGEGVYVYDNEGNNYLDCAAGIAVSNIGYGVKEVIDAMHEQAKKITYVYGGTFTSEAKERLANQIIDLAPDGMEKVFFCSGGSEAVESIIKIARQYQIEKENPSKYKIISRWQSYHGVCFFFGHVHGEFIIF